MTADPNRSRSVLLGGLLLVVLSLFASRLSVTTDLRRLLPTDGPLNEAVSALETLKVANTMIVEVNGQGVSTDTLLQHVDALGSALSAQPRFGEVRYRVNVEDGIAIQSTVAPHAIALLPENTLAERLSPDGIKTTLWAQLTRLMGPAGSLFEPGFKADPLDLTGLAMAQLRSEGPFRFEAKNGHLMDASGTRAILLLQPEESTLGKQHDEPLVEVLDAVLKTCPLPVQYHGGHRIAADAERLMRADMMRAGCLGIAGTCLILWGMFRSFRPLLGALGPLALSLSATFAAAALFRPVHVISLAFVASLLGLAVDYWIHLYAGATATDAGSTVSSRWSAASGALRRMLPALSLGAGSTVGASLVLMTSDYPVVRDLGLMGAAAASGAFVGTLLFGPMLVALVGPPGKQSIGPSGVSTIARPLVLLGLIAMTLGAMGTQFDGDPRSLSPWDPDTLQIQQSLSDRYGGFGQSGLVVIKAPTTEEALDQAARVQGEMASLPGVSAIGPASVLPGPTLTAERRALLPDKATLQARIDGAAEGLGFSPDALAGAAQRILAPPTENLTAQTWEDTPLSTLASGHLNIGTDEVTATVSLVLQDQELIHSVQRGIMEVAPDASIILPTKLAQSGVQDIVSELRRLGGLAIGGVLILLAIRYRDPRRVMAAILPSLAALAAALGVMGLCAIPWTVISACGVPLLVGLGLDYGVFMTESTSRQADTRTAFAVRVSAMTTMAGFGALMVSTTPALFGLGLAVFSGMIGAGLAALSLTPALAQGDPILTGRLGRWARLGLTASLIWINIDQLGQAWFFLTPPTSEAPPTLQRVEVAPGDWHFGPNRLLKSNGLYSMYTEGGAYERGFAMGALGPELHERLEAESIRTFETHVPFAFFRYLITRGSALFAPHLDQYLRHEDRLEIKGTVDARPDPLQWMAPAYTREVYYHAIHDIGQAVVDTPFVMACTGFMAGPGATADAHWIMGRNFDFDGGAVFDQDKIVSFVKPELGIPYVSVTFMGMVGVVTGVNAHGLAVAIQAAGSDDPPQPGTPMTLILREILQTASSVNEAEAILKNRRGSVSENVLVMDADGGEAVVFEVTPKRIDRLTVEKSLGVANHFRSPVFKDDQTNFTRQQENTTARRQARMDELLATHDGAITLDTSANILSDRAGLGDQPLAPGHRWAIDADIATHSVVIDATSRTIWVSRYPNIAGGYVSFSLEKGLSGDIQGTEVRPPEKLTRTFNVHRSRQLLSESSDRSAIERDQAARRALTLAPEHPAALKRLAEALVDQDRHLEAKPIIKRALAAQPEFAHEKRELLTLEQAVR